jgi:hypothetical protein
MDLLEGLKSLGLVRVWAPGGMFTKTFHQGGMPDNKKYYRRAVQRASNAKGEQCQKYI